MSMSTIIIVGFSLFACLSIVIGLQDYHKKHMSKK